jgi:hypothetical protein
MSYGVFLKSHSAFLKYYFGRRYNHPGIILRFYSVGIVPPEMTDGPLNAVEGYPEATPIEYTLQIG